MVKWWVRIALGSVITLELAALLQPVQAQQAERCFPETGFCISGRIRTFWEQNGGLPVFGFPNGPQQDELIEGRSLQVQWFERNRLELHPENPAPSDVLLGRLGADRLEQQGRDWQDFPKSTVQPGCRFFSETGHNVCGAILARWRASGLEQDGRLGTSEGESLALFGLPLSGELRETLSDGREYTVQYFERARFEIHPELATSNPVLLGLLGSEVRPFSTSLIDRTEDVEGVGFPDQRKIVRDSRGALYVAYRKKVNNIYRIFVARSSNNGGAWSVLNSNAPIENIGPYTQRNPAIAIDADDTLHVVWYGMDVDHSKEGHRQIKYARSQDGGLTWSNWATIAEVSGYDGQNRWQEHPVLYVRDRVISVVWEGFDSSSEREEQIKLVRSLDGGQTWSRWQSISPEPNRSHSRPTVVASADGNQLYVLAYGERGQNKQIIWTTSSDRGVTWTPWASVAPSSSEQRDVSVAIDAAGRLHAVWQQEQPTGKPQVMYGHFEAGSWSPPTVLAANVSATQFFPSITSDQNRLHVVWTESDRQGGNGNDDPEKGRIMGSSRPNGQPWSTPIQLNPTGISGYQASLGRGSVGTGGLVDVVWMDTSDTSNPFIRHTLWKVR